MLLPGLTLRQILLTGLTLLAAGCNSREQVTSYTVRKPELIDPTLAAAAAAAEPKPTQILGAIALLEEAGWFFKITGDPAQVESKRDDFLAFVKSVRFTGAQPQPSWDLPTGWTELPPDEFRFATLQIPADPKPLELAVSVLPKNVAAEEFVLINVNRWRGQVSLPPIIAADLDKETETFKVDDHDCKFVSLVGESAGGGMGGAPFAPFARGASAAPGTSPTTPVRPRATGASAVEDKLTFETPDGWAPGKTNEFRRAAFIVKDGEKEVEITVIPLGLGSGTLLENVNRWRGEVKLPDAKESDLPTIVKKVDALGVKADYVELVGPAKTTLGAIAPVGDQVWFVKLKGDNELAARENARFQEFVKSLRLK
jgi:hypothetical protein